MVTGSWTSRERRKTGHTACGFHGLPDPIEDGSTSSCNNSKQSNTADSREDHYCGVRGMPRECWPLSSRFQNVKLKFETPCELFPFISQPLSLLQNSSFSLECPSSSGSIGTHTQSAPAFSTQTDAMTLHLSRRCVHHALNNYRA